jgi:hypothetical protein
MSKYFFIRDLESDQYRENFLVSSVVTVFAIRIFLKLTDYPQLGIGNLHIAHILWGGVFMLAAIIILLSFLNKSSLQIASVLGGIGFGTFIDEFGKVVTRDNNYFFRPTIAYIYIIFVLIYLAFHIIARYRPVSKKEYLVNAIAMLKESIITDFDTEEKQQAREYLQKADQRSRVVESLTHLFDHIDALPPSKPNTVIRFRHILKRIYWSIAKSDLILKGVIAFLAFQTLRTITQSIMLLVLKPTMPFEDWGKLLSSFLAASFIIVGFFMLRFSKIESYRFFRIAVLISLLLTDFFSLIQLQWYELLSIAGNVFVLQVINYAQLQEREKGK